MTKITLKINGMSCKGCSNSVENLIDKLPGVVSRKVNHQNGLAIINFDESKISESEIVKKINEGHYKVSGKENLVVKDEVLKCPECKCEGLKVPETVFSSVLKPGFKKRIDLTTDNYICINATCEIIYFTEKYSLRKEALKRPLWLKDTSNERIICYCNNITENMIKEAVEANGLTEWEDIIKLYRKKVIEKCETLNPLGICCKEVFTEITGKYKKRDT